MARRPKDHIPAPKTTAAKKATVSKELQDLCNNPAAKLGAIDENSPYNFNYGDKTFTVVKSEQVPSQINPISNTLSTKANGGQIKHGAAKLRSGKWAVSQLNNLLKGLRKTQSIMIESPHGTFAIVYKDIELVKSHSATFDDAAKPTNAAAPTEPDAPKEAAPEANDNKLGEDIDLKAVKTITPQAESFARVDWTQFIHGSNEKNKTLDAYDHVTRDNGIALVNYSRRTKPIGFMLPYNALNIDDITTNGRWQISKFSQALQKRWAADPLNPDIVSIQHQSKAPMIYMTMGAAIELMSSGLFDNAPDFVQDALLEAGVDVEKRKAGMAKAAAKAEAAPKAPVAEETPAPVAKEPADEKKDENPVAPPAEPEPDSDGSFMSEAEATRRGLHKKQAAPAEQAENALAILRRAIAEAKETNDVVEAMNGVVIGTNNDAIKAMEEVIGFAEDMGVPAAEIKTIAFNPTNMVGMMQSFMEAQKEAEKSDALVILQPNQGDRMVMTRNQDLIGAYKLTM